MAEEKEEKKEGEAEVAASNGAKRKKLLIIGGVAALVLVSAGIPTTLLLMKSSKSEKVEELDSHAAESDTENELQARLAEHEEQLEEGEEVVGAIVPFDTFVVNLDQARYARIQLQVEFTGLDVPRRFYNKVPLMRDTVITLLTQKTAEKLLSPNGKENLRGEIRDKLNDVLKHEDIKRVYFTQFVVQ